jgi:RNA polymerase sigma-70 factor (ECF subfamily)
MPGLTPPPSASEADDRCVQRTIAGDREAFGLLWDRHHERVYGYCLRWLGTVDAAEDATAETFRRALTNLRAYRGGGFRSWLFAIAHNVASDESRRQRATTSLDVELELPDHSSRPDDQAIRTVEIERIRHLLGALPQGQRDVISLRLAGLTPIEIARTLSVSRAAVDMAHHRAIVKLRDLLGIVVPEEQGARDG